MVLNCLAGLTHNRGTGERNLSETWFPPFKGKEKERIEMYH